MSISTRRFSSIKISHLVFLSATLGIYAPFYVDSIFNITVRRLSLIALVCIFGVVLIKNRRVHITTGEVTMCLVYILTVFSISWSYYPIISANRVFDLFFIAVFYIIFSASGSNLPRPWWRTLVLFSIISTILAVVYTLGIYQFGGGVNENAVGRFAVVSIPILVVGAIESADYKRHVVLVFLY